MHSLKFGLIVALFASSLAAQTPVSTARAPHSLSEYEGTYAYSPGRDIEMVADGELFAVLDDNDFLCC